MSRDVETPGVVASRILGRYRDLEAAARLDCRPLVQGRLTRVVGMALEAEGLNSALGQRCLIHSDGGGAHAEVVGFSGSTTYLMPLHRLERLRAGARIVPLAHGDQVPVGDGLLGRVLSAAGRPLDGRGPLRGVQASELLAAPINPMRRRVIREPMDVGVRSINGLLTVGRGQRLGIFAGSGVGKSMLMGMMTRFTAADVTVVGLVGERGREAREFIEDTLGEQGMRRAVVVVSPADEGPLLRLRCARVATRIAEHFRDSGRNVLLLMDSLTRFAQAQREIGLAIGEPPATRGYTPSVFARIPELVERAGNNSEGTGSITAFYTVLVEGDDLQDPVADAARAILDGHVVLSRSLAEEGQYPAVDVEASISRAMPTVAEPAHIQRAQRFRRLYARYMQERDLISVGAYAAGSDPDTDAAIALMPSLRGYLRQGLDERVDLATSLQQLQDLIADPPALRRTAPPETQQAGA